MANAGDGGRWLAPGLGPLIGLRVSVSRNPWRIGPAWAVVAGALAGGMPLTGGVWLLRLLGGVLLADSAWGAVWAVMAGGSGEAQPAARWALPYIQPSAPVVQAGERLRGLASGAGCNDLLMSTLLAAGLAALLGVVPLLLTLAVIPVALIAQLIAERGGRPAACYACLAVALPWALGLALAGRPPAELIGPAGLGFAFALLVWGGERLRGLRQTSIAGALLGEAAVLGALACLRLPWAACLAAVLFLPSSWWLLRLSASPRLRPVYSTALDYCSIWWWFVLILAATALRQIVVS